MLPWITSIIWSLQVYECRSVWRHLTWTPCLTLATYSLHDIMDWMSNKALFSLMSSKFKRTDWKSALKITPLHKSEKKILLTFNFVIHFTKTFSFIYIEQRWWWLLLLLCLLASSPITLQPVEVALTWEWQENSVSPWFYSAEGKHCGAFGQEMFRNTITHNLNNWPLQSRKLLIFDLSFPSF